MLVYDITSRSSYDIVLTIKHKISMRHREVGLYSCDEKLEGQGGLFLN